jgi:hypothetical protein
MLLFPPPESWFHGEDGINERNICNRHNYYSNARDDDSHGNDNHGREECCDDNSLLLLKRLKNPNGRGMVQQLYDNQEQQSLQQQQLLSNQQSQRRQRNVELERLNSKDESSAEDLCLSFQFFAEPFVDFWGIQVNYEVNPTDSHKRNPKGNVFQLYDHVSPRYLPPP